MIDNLLVVGVCDEVKVALAMECSIIRLTSELYAMTTYKF